jgi:hypothetical protein
MQVVAETKPTLPAYRRAVAGHASSSAAWKVAWAAREPPAGSATKIRCRGEVRRRFPAGVTVVPKSGRGSLRQETPEAQREDALALASVTTRLAIGLRGDADGARAVA